MPVGADWDRPTDWLPLLNSVKQAADELGTKLRFGYTWTQNPDDKPAPFLDAPHGLNGSQALDAQTAATRR